MQGEAAQVKVIGVAMAFCCHHRCQWNNYTGREFFNVSIIEILESIFILNFKII